MINHKREGLAGTKCKTPKIVLTIWWEGRVGSSCLRVLLQKLENQTSMADKPPGDSWRFALLDFKCTRDHGEMGIKRGEGDGLVYGTRRRQESSGWPEIGRRQPVQVLLRGRLLSGGRRCPAMEGRRGPAKRLQLDAVIDVVALDLQSVLRLRRIGNWRPAAVLAPASCCSEGARARAGGASRLLLPEAREQRGDGT